MKRHALTQALAHMLFVSLSFGSLAAAPETPNGALLRTLEARLTQFHALQEKRIAAGDMPAAKIYRTNVLLNRAQYLAKEKTRAEFLSTSGKLHGDALAALDVRIKLGNPPSDEEYQTIFEAALADIALK